MIKSRIPRLPQDIDYASVNVGRGGGGWVNYPSRGGHGRK